MKPFKEATSLKPRLKMLIWGEAGTGKTPLALQFPKPVIIDLDGGSYHYAKDFKFDIITRKDVDTFVKIKKAVLWLKQNKHEYETLIIDPLTIARLLHIQHMDETFFAKKSLAEKSLSVDVINWTTLHWVRQRADWMKFVLLLLSLDMNIIATCRVQDVLEAKRVNDRVEFAVIGEKPGSDKEDTYLFDINMRIEFNKKRESICCITRDRTKTFLKLHDPIKKFKLDYAEFQKHFNTILNQGGD